MESNPANYHRQRKLLPRKYLRPLELRLYRGMKVSITRNVNKKIGFNNGMQCVVEDYDAASGGVRLKPMCGGRITSYLWTDKDLGDITYHPLRPGYCSTIIKYQGAELEHVTVWLDTPGIGAAAYTALSRVKTQEDYLIGGNVNPHHFTPAVEAWQRRYGERAHGRGAASTGSRKRKRE